MVEAAKRISTRVAGPRLIALVGPFQSGKTTLLESLLARTGALSRQGSVRDGSPASATPAVEARAHAMSVEANVASADYLGDRITFIDCPGSVEFPNDMRQASAAVRRGGRRLRGGRAQAAGAAAHPARTRRPGSRASCSSTRSTAPPRACARRSPCCSRPRARRCCCARSRSGRTASPPASSTSRSSAPSSIANMRPPRSSTCPPANCRARRKRAIPCWKRLADYDDALMEELLTDIEPPRDQMFDDLAQDLRTGLVVPLLIGSAERGNGVTRLLKALRHEAPGVAATRARLGVQRARARRWPASSARSTRRTAASSRLSRVLRGSFRRRRRRRSRRAARTASPACRA